ncbi:zinc finger, CCHC-type containing protein [Tanacetum coccineum]|uniref:Zinc finger, CCHC-type containing protein n=1 Tax=Tanacetum coccineum TaxID=301880 RepID=A0ABQ5AN98_9ASTR
MAGNTVKDMTTNFGKLDKFEGHDFRRWQKKMHFLLTTLKVVYVLTTPMPELLEDATVEAIRIRAKDPAKELWIHGESKYMAEDSSSKKFLNCSFPGRIFKHTLKQVKMICLGQLGSPLAHKRNPKGRMTVTKQEVRKLLFPSVNNDRRGTGHFKRDHRSGKKNNANAGGSGKGLMQLHCGIDSGATTHVCKDRCWFKTFEPVEDGSVLYMGDEHSLIKKRHFAPIHGKGSVALDLVFLGKLLLCIMCCSVPKRFRIIHETNTSTLHTTSKNGVAERKNRALKEMVNSMLSYSGLSEGFWGEAMLTACYLLNRGRRKGYRPERKTLVIKGIDCIFVDYLKSRDAIFDENRFSSIPRPKDIIPNVQESQMDDHTDDVPNEIPEPRRGKRAKKAKSYGSDFQLYLVRIEEIKLDHNTHIAIVLRKILEPMMKLCNLEMLLSGKKQLMMRLVLLWEIIQWVLSDLPPGCKPLGCKWIFKRKMKVDGTIDKFKARLIVVSFSIYLQFSDPSNGVKNTFLNGDLDEEVYMKQPKLDFEYASGWVFLLGGGTISWASKKQTCITGSTMESEFVALAAAGKEAEWLRNLIHEIPIWPKPIAPISIRCDSAPTMARAYSQIYNGKSRHLGVRHSMLEIGTQVSTSRGARSKGTTYVNMKFSRFKKLGLGFLYVHQWIGTHGL